jgi:hypothetical protein
MYLWYPSPRPTVDLSFCMVFHVMSISKSDEFAIEKHGNFFSSHEKGVMYASKSVRFSWICFCYCISWRNVLFTSCITGRILCFYKQRNNVVCLLL